MPTIRNNVTIDATPDEVWAVLSDMTATRLVFALISTLYLVVAIPFEERSLIETFGPDYASYQRKVRWRMMPGLH